MIAAKIKYIAAIKSAGTNVNRKVKYHMDGELSTFFKTIIPKIDFVKIS